MTRLCGGCTYLGMTIPKNKSDHSLPTCGRGFQPFRRSFAGATEEKPAVEAALVATCPRQGVEEVER